MINENKNKPAFVNGAPGSMFCEKGLTKKEYFMAQILSSTSVYILSKFDSYTGVGIEKEVERFIAIASALADKALEEK